jgi:hypothetical protein
MTGSGGKARGQGHRRYAATQTETKAANAFGGLVYIETPYDLKIGKITITIEGAVRAPYYVLGKTDAEKWRQKIRNHSAPWGELAGRKLILTLPSKVLRTVDDPEDLMKFWDSVMDRYAELLGRDQQRRRLERFVPDIQISAATGTAACGGSSTRLGIIIRITTGPSGGQGKSRSICSRCI